MNLQTMVVMNWTKSFSVVYLAFYMSYSLIDMASWLSLEYIRIISSCK